MERRQIHPDGPTCSRLVAGAWRWGNVRDQIKDLIHTSLDVGMTTFDHAHIYGNYENEALFGNVLRADPSLRTRMELVTKCGIMLLSDRRPEHRVKHYDTSREHIIWSAEQSLQLLATDYIDVLLIHRPDPLMDPAEVAEAFITLKQQGKVLHFGVSNFTPTQFELLQQHLPFPLVTNQIELSLFRPEPLTDGTVDVMMKHRASSMAWSPLGGGKPFDHHHHHQPVVQALSGIASRYGGATLTQMLLAWLLRHPSAIFPVIGTTQASRIRESAQALNIHLDRQDWFEMLQLSVGREVA